MVAATVLVRSITGTHARREWEDHKVTASVGAEPTGAAQASPELWGGQRNRQSEALIGVVAGKRRRL